MLYSVVAFSYGERDEANMERKRKRRRQGAAAKQADAGADEDRHRSYAYVLLGTRVCRNCVCRLHGVSKKALVTAQDGVGRGHLAPPATKRGQNRKGARFDRTKAVIEFLEQPAADERMAEATAAGGHGGRGRGGGVYVRRR